MTFTFFNFYGLTIAFAISLVFKAHNQLVWVIDNKGTHTMLMDDNGFLWLSFTNGFWSLTGNFETNSTTNFIEITDAS